MNLIAQHLAARQRRSAATEPGDVDGGIVAGGLAQRQIAPDFHRGLGLLDILEKGEFAVIAAPAAGIEQFGEVLQPLLGERAPACNNVAATCHVCSMCHESARKEKERTRTQRGTNQLDVTGIFCGKLLRCPAATLIDASQRQEPGGSSLSPVKPGRGTAGLRSAPIGEMQRAVPNSTVIIREADDPVRRSVEAKMLKLWNTGRPLKSGNDSPICVERIGP